MSKLKRAILYRYLYGDKQIYKYQFKRKKRLRYNGRDYNYRKHMRMITEKQSIRMLPYHYPEQKVLIRVYSDKTIKLLTSKNWGDPFPF